MMPSAEWPFRDTEQDVAVAELIFHYDAGEVPCNSLKEQFVTVQDNTLYHCPRNFAFEAKAYCEIEEHFFSMEEGGKIRLYFVDDTAEAILDFLVYKIPALEQQGWRCTVDENFPLQVTREEEVDWYTEVEESEYNWFDLSLGISVDGQQVNLLPLFAEIIEKNKLRDLKHLPDSEKFAVKLPNGKFFPIPIARVRNVLQVLIELYDSENLTAGKLTLPTFRAGELLALEQAFEHTKMRWLGGERLRKLGNKLKNFKGIKKTTVPTAFNAKLRPYQKKGIDWLQFLREYELAGILADDMGLGKTVQTLAHLLIEKKANRMQKPTLIVAPTSLMVNWRLEAERFSPDLKVLTLQGADRKSHYDAIDTHDLVLTTYPLLARDADVLTSKEYHYLILDEAQFIKNPKAKSTQIAHQLKANHRLCLTGTPMENHLGELWSLFHFLMPGLLGESVQFKRLFRTPIEKYDDHDRSKILARRIKPFMLRRTKDKVIKELPKKTEITRYVELEELQRELYESVRIAMHQKVAKAIQQKGLNRSHILILDALLKLRQICCDPRLLPLDAVKNKPYRSAKLECLMDMLPELVEEGGRILIFSQFTSMLALIEEALTKKDLPYVKLTGRTKDRATPIEIFQAKQVPIFLISLKAGGTGLNLTAADTVIHYDPWWNPAVENQATDRAHRIGQKNAVFVYKLIVKGSLEETICKMQQKKQNLMEGLFSTSGGSKVLLDAKDLELLFSPLDSEGN